MWKVTWEQPPQSGEELFMWRVYTRCWDDIGARAPGIWVANWLRRDQESDHMLEAIYWYINQCNE